MSTLQMNRGKRPGGNPDKTGSSSKCLCTLTLRHQKSTVAEPGRGQGMERALREKFNEQKTKTNKQSSCEFWIYAMEFGH